MKEQYCAFKNGLETFSDSTKKKTKSCFFMLSFWQSEKMSKRWQKDIFLKLSFRQNKKMFIRCLLILSKKQLKKHIFLSSFYDCLFDKTKSRIK